MPPRARSSAKSSRASSAVPIDSSEVNTGTNSPATSLEEEAKDATYDPVKEEAKEAEPVEQEKAKSATQVRSTFLFSITGKRIDDRSG
jgi:hypothetical protein